MSERMVLHIGAMKTGTTFLQTTLERNRELLAASGVDFTGGRFAFQTRAVSNVLRRPVARGSRVQKWRRLAELAREAEQRTSVVSMEFLSFADERQLTALLRPLRRFEVHVVMTVRDQLQVAPAQWQTYCRNQGTSSWGRYLREIEPDRNGRPGTSHAYRTFHRAQDVDRILRRWAAAPGVDQVHVVTVPGRDSPPDELWRRFFAAVGEPAPAADLGLAAPNTSLGYGSCDLLRRLNHHLGDVPGPRYRQGMRRLAREALAARRDLESRPALDRRGAAYARSLNEQLRATVATEGFHLHGDVEDLPVPATVADHDRRPATVGRGEARAAAVAAWEYLHRQAGEEPPAPPRRLGTLVAGNAQLLRRVNGWD